MKRPLVFEIEGNLEAGKVLVVCPDGKDICLQNVSGAHNHYRTEIQREVKHSWEPAPKPDNAGLIIAFASSFLALVIAVLALVRSNRKA